MVRTVLKGAAFTALGTAALVISFGALTAADEKTPTIKEIMKKGHASTGLLNGIKGHAKAGEWAEAQNDAKLLKAFGEALGKATPPKGEGAGWKTQADKYKANTVAVAEAVDKKDAKGVNEALGKITGSCKECHSAHKGK